MAGLEGLRNKAQQQLDELRKNRERDLFIIGQEAKTLVQLRIQTSGTNYEGSAFEPYTPGYAAQRDKKGRQTNYVDFTDTDRLWANVAPSVEIKGAIGIVTIKARNRENQVKLEGAEDKRGNILLLSEKGKEHHFGTEPTKGSQVFKIQLMEFIKCITFGSKDEGFDLSRRRITIIRKSEITAFTPVLWGYDVVSRVIVGGVLMYTDLINYDLVNTYEPVVEDAFKSRHFMIENAKESKRYAKKLMNEDGHFKNSPDVLKEIRDSEQIMDYLNEYDEYIKNLFR
jgi:hypothetical protein